MSIAKIVLLLATAAAAAFADTIDFENQCPMGKQANRPCSNLFSTVGNAETLSIPTAIGNVTVQGGALFDDIANLPADETVVYGTPGNSSGIGVFPGSGFTNPITITNVEYQVADNASNSADMALAANFAGGLQTIAFNDTGTVVTIDAVNGQSTPSGITRDFLIDNISFNASTPEPASTFLMGIGLVALRPLPELLPQTL